MRGASSLKEGIMVIYIFREIFFQFFFKVSHAEILYKDHINKKQEPESATEVPPFGHVMYVWTLSSLQGKQTVGPSCANRRIFREMSAFPSILVPFFHQTGDYLGSRVFPPALPSSHMELAPRGGPQQRALRFPGTEPPGWLPWTARVRLEAGSVHPLQCRGMTAEEELRDPAPRSLGGGGSRCFTAQGLTDREHPRGELSIWDVCSL